MMNKRFEDVKTLFIEQDRLIGRFVDFANEFISFEYDTTGINFDEAEDIERKAEIIANKIFSEINLAQELYKFEVIEIITKTRKIVFKFKNEDLEFTGDIVLDKDGFELEIKENIKPIEQEEVQKEV